MTKLRAVRRGARVIGDVQNQKIHPARESVKSDGAKASQDFIDQPELLRRLPISRRTEFEWRANKKLPFVRVGKRKILYHWPTVVSTLVRLQRVVE